MSMKTKAVLCAVTALGGLVLVAPQSSATTYPTSHFEVTYGATYTQGTITWYNRSVQLTGTMRSLSSSGCRRTDAYTYNAAQTEPPLGSGGTSAQCGDAIKALPPIDVPADVAGGAAYVVVCLADGDGTYLGDCEGYSRSDAS